MEKTAEEWAAEHERIMEEHDRQAEEERLYYERGRMKKAKLICKWHQTYGAVFKELLPNSANPTFNDLDNQKVALKKQRKGRTSYMFSVFDLAGQGESGYLAWFESQPLEDRRLHEYIRRGMPCRVFWDLEWVTPTAASELEITSVIIEVVDLCKIELRHAIGIEEGARFETKWAVWDGSRPISGGTAWKNSYHLIENTIVLDDYTSMRNLAARVNNAISKECSSAIDFSLYTVNGAWLRLPHNHKSGEEGSVLLLHMRYTRLMGYGEFAAEDMIKGDVVPYHGVYIDTKTTRKKLVHIEPLSKVPFRVSPEAQINHATGENVDAVAFYKRMKIEQDIYKKEFEDNSFALEPVASTILNRLTKFETYERRGYYEMDVTNELCAVATLNQVRAILPTGEWLVKIEKRELGRTFITYEVVKANYCGLHEIRIPVMIQVGKEKLPKIIPIEITKYIQMHQYMLLTYTGGTIFEPWSYSLMMDLFHGNGVHKGVPNYGNCFNRFRGFALDVYPVQPNWQDDMKAKVAPFLKWVYDTLAYSQGNVPGEQDRLYHSLISRIQDMLRYPGKRLNCVTMLQGQPGVGKTGFVTLISHLLGQQYSIEFNNIEDLERHFNSALQEKLLICVNEATKDSSVKNGGGFMNSDMTGLSAILKALITEDVAVITRKYKEAVKERLWFNLFLTSDRFGRFWLDGMDRRVDFFSCRPWPTDKKEKEKAEEKTKEMFRSINTLNDPEAILFRHYLFLYIKYFYTRPDDFTYEAASKCSAKAIATRNSYPPEVHHFNALMSSMHVEGTTRWIDDDEHDIHPILSTDKQSMKVSVRSCYVAFLKSNQISERMAACYSQTAYSKALQERLRLISDTKGGTEHFYVPIDWVAFAKTVYLV